jgi:S1-C subfamily serine protease
MRLPRLPDWLIYAGVVGALLALALNRREPAAPAPAPTPASSAAKSVPVPRPEAEGAALPPPSPYDPAINVDVPDHAGPATGTAFSVASSGVWVTARHVVDGCAQAALVVAPGQGVAARVAIDPAGEAALLTTEGGAPALPLALDQPLREGELAFHPGFPQGKPGEAASRLIGRENLMVHGRGGRTEPVLAWAEVGRSAGLTGSLGGLSGAPALDAQGRVIGVTIAEAPRRGRIYTTTPETLARLIARRSAPLPVATVQSGALTPANYGAAAQALRRDLRVAEAVCLV